MRANRSYTGEVLIKQQGGSLFFMFDFLGYKFLVYLY